jgi:hypothetical protein
MFPQTDNPHPSASYDLPFSTFLPIFPFPLQPLSTSGDSTSSTALIEQQKCEHCPEQQLPWASWCTWWPLEEPCLITPLCLLFILVQTGHCYLLFPLESLEVKPIYNWTLTHTALSPWRWRHYEKSSTPSTHTAKTQEHNWLKQKCYFSLHCKMFRELCPVQSVPM